MMAVVLNVLYMVMANYNFYKNTNYKDTPCGIFNYINNPAALTINSSSKMAVWRNRIRSCMMTVHENCITRCLSQLPF